jgi:hypothetical protein
MHHATKHLKSKFPISIFAGFVKISLAACLAREQRAGPPIKVRFAPDSDITEGPGWPAEVPSSFDQPGLEGRTALKCARI